MLAPTIPFMISPDQAFQNQGVSPMVVLGLALLFTWGMAYEIQRARWRPYFWVTGLATIALPFLFLTPSAVFFDSGYPEFFALVKQHPYRVMGLIIGMAVFEIALMGSAYENLLSRFNSKTQRSWSIDSLFSQARKTSPLKSKRAETIHYAVFFLIWAPLAEEIFYWGFVFRVLRPEWGLFVAAAITSVIFTFRHAFHFIPHRVTHLPALLMLLASTFISAILNSCLFEVTGSIEPLICLHFVINIASSILYAQRTRASQIIN